MNSSTASIKSVLENIPDACTSVELNLVSSVIVPDILYDTSFTKDAFMQLLSKMRKTHYPIFQKQCKRYAHADYEYLHYNDQEKYTVNKRKLVNHICFDTNKVVVSLLKKEAALPFMFPWSADVHDVSYISRVTFKVSNRLFLNFEVHYQDSTDAPTPTYHIYLNYNHGTNVEQGTLVPSVLKVLSQLGIAMR